MAAAGEGDEVELEPVAVGWNSRTPASSSCCQATKPDPAVAFASASSLMPHKVPCAVAERAPEVDPLVLRLFDAPAEKEGALIRRPGLPPD
jgi:hypothetical protein